MTLGVSPHILSVKDLKVTRAAGDIPFTVSLPHLSLNRNEIVSLTGVSGSGKSTLLEVLGLISKPSQLKMFELCLPLKNKRLVDLTESIIDFKEFVLAPIRANALGFILQTGGLLPFLSVRDNIQLVRKQKGLTLWADFVNQLVSELKLMALLNKFPHELSIGERQRVAFIRSVAHEPALVLADEPTAALDPYTADMLFDLLKSIAQELNLSVLLVSHDWQLLKKHQIRGLRARINDSNESEFVHE
ncbi:ABC transporter ATP-binding protein [Thorsellia kenyensis]|uniref:Putative hemin import ATP-binding protein HrtA n=1 Tax=Thorsellia kenyensis TaxID=1549888 RepID=A0ABV6CA77_9GAMM